jgi:hypothetical protein
MRITRDRLISLAKNFALEETFRDKQIACIFLTGSALGEQFLLNDTTDIDLILIHRSKNNVERKTIRINNQVHYDCWTYPIRLFQDSKTLRTETWIGSSFSGETLLLYDEGHWFNFQQAAIFSKFFDPETRYLRCKPQLDKARTHWLSLDILDDEPAMQEVIRYMDIIENLGNIIAGLVGMPLTIRRFGLELPEKAVMLGKPGLAAGLFDLYCPPTWQDFPWQDWLSGWQSLWDQVNSLPDVPAEFQSFCKDYYLQPVQVFMQEEPQAALWILINTMLTALQHLKANNIKPAIPLENLLTSIKLNKNEFEQRVSELDSYLDALEMTMEEWAKDQGLVL